MTHRRGSGKREWRSVKRMCGSIFTTFDPCLKKIFTQYGSMPSKVERKRGRHEPRADIPAKAQALTYSGFCNLCADFKLSVGTKMFRRSVKSADLAAVFLDSLEGGRLGRSSDTMGGLEYEEFWQAFVRLVLRLNDKTSQTTDTSGGESSNGIQRHGSHRNIKGKHGRTPLYIAAEGGHVFIVKCLLSHTSIDVNSRCLSVCSLI